MLNNAQTLVINGGSFNNVSNNVITGGSFNNYVINGGSFNNTINISETRSEAPLSALHKLVAPNAILNSGGRADQVRCYPGTRTEVIDRVEKWRVDAWRNVASRIFWLNGPAGAGKTAILQTLGERWTYESDGMFCANFFFFKGDPSRNHADSFISTLLYQIFDFYPAMRAAVEQKLLAKPRILESSIKEQFDQLISKPFRAIGQQVLQPIILLVDGLDECEEKMSQRRIVRALSTLVNDKDLPFLVLVGSRNEHQLTIAFGELPVTTESTFLDEKYTPEKDIRFFVTAEFDQIKRMHFLAPRDKNWPSASDINSIVSKSSGQFLYAATVMHFIATSSTSPIISLQRIQGAAPFTAFSPFSQLDAIYSNILSQARDQQALRDVLHVAFALRSMGKEYNAMLLRVLSTYNCRYTSSVIHSCISDMVAIACLQQRELHFYHASLVDYLYDQSRSQGYFINLVTFGPKILPAIWEHIGKMQAVQFAAKFALEQLISMLPDFMNTIIELEVADFGTFGNLQDMGNVFKIIYEQCVKNDNVATYKKMIGNWIILYLSTQANSPNEELYSIPESKRYIKMVEIGYAANIVEPTAHKASVDVLCPSSVFEAHETALWLRDLLHRLFDEVYPQNPADYKHLMYAWISWAVSNNIHLDGLNNLPYAQQYIWKCMAQGFLKAIVEK